MSRHYSSTTTSSSRSVVGGNVDPTDHTVVPTKADIYRSRPSANMQQQQMKGFEGMEPMAQANLQLMLHQNVRPIITSRSLIINRSAPDPFQRGSRTYSDRVYRVGSANLGSITPGAYTSVATNSVGAVMESRDKEKRDMQDLNERLANYLEKVRFLEAQNRSLASELERLKKKWGLETSQVKAMYQTELDEARRLLDDAVKDKGKLEIKVASLEDVVEDLRGKLADITAAATDWKDRWESSIQQVANAEAEAGAMRMKTEGMESERERDKKTISKLQDLLQSARQDLDNETLLHVEAASRLQTLEEELAFLKSVHDQEMKEMATLVHRDSTPDNRAFWKNEMGAALKDIQDMYDEKMEDIRTEMETTYNAKIQEFRAGATKNSLETVHSREENKRLKSSMVDLRERLSELEGQNLGLHRDLDTLKHESEVRERELERDNDQLKLDVAKLRAEIDAVMMELQHIMDSKVTLELEIAAYRKLLEGEEHRLLELEANLAKSKTGGESAGKGGTGGISQGGTGGTSHGGIGGPSHGGSGGTGFGGSGYGGGDNLNDSFSPTSQKSWGQYSSSNRSPSKPGDSPRYSYQRSSKGACGFAESSPDGKFIIIENIGRKDEDLGSWMIKRIVNGADQLEYVLDSKFILKSNSKVKIWSRGNKPPGASYSDVEAKLNNWGVGDNVVTKLLSPNGDERASYTQKIAI